MKKNILKMIATLINVALDLMAFLICLDSYSEIGVICAVYIAVKFLAPHCNRLSVTAQIVYNQAAEWVAKRKEAKEVEPVAEVIEAVEAEEI